MDRRFYFNDDVFVVYRDKICVSNDANLRKVTLNEAHCSKYTIHPRVYNMKRHWWWPGIKRDVI